MTQNTLRPVELNRAVADRLDLAGELLSQQGANPYRVRAYRRAAETVAGLEQSVRSILARGGLEGLKALPDIGPAIAGAIEEIVRTGRWGQLERLQGAAAPEQLFRTLPGVGPALARRLHEHLHVDTLEALEMAAHDGRLEMVPGVGRRRAEMLRAELAMRLRAGRPCPRRLVEEPSVALLLDADREYRARAGRDELPRIAPRRYNPRREAWLPIGHLTREPWHVTALYSNTAVAHELGRTKDWVVLYFHRDDDHREGQRTVVTETRGELEGRRVVRGRERECLAHYRHELAGERAAGARR